MMNNFQIPPQLIQMLKGGRNPQQMLSNMLQGNQDPMAQNIMSMINNNDGNAIEKFARNICKSRGIDADELMKNIQNQLQ